MEENKPADVVIEKDELTLTQEKLLKAEADRDNYKNVALKRLGKLPNDAEFLNETSELSVAEQIRIALLDKEVSDARKLEQEATTKLIRENAELRLALKNQPNSSLGGDSGTDSETKDNFFSKEQLENLKQRALRLKADPEVFIENAKKNLLRSR